MKNLTFIALLLQTMIMRAQTPLNDPHWKLVWEDNFDSLNTNIWLVQDNFDHWGEQTVYIDDNVYCQNGNLTLEIKNESYSCPTWAISPYYCQRQDTTGLVYSYTSGWVESKQAYNTQYGYLEARIQFPFGLDLWPSFWTFVGSGVTNATNAAEIDIAEMVAYINNAHHKLTTNVHLDFITPPSLYYEEHSPTNFSWADGSWHKYAVDWSPSRLIFYVDDSPVRDMANPGVIDPVLLILSMGLDKGPVTGTGFPLRMNVDYVKVYDLATDCNNSLTMCNYNFGLHDNKVKKEIFIGNGVCSNSLSTGDKVYLRATDQVVITGDFTVPVGAELFIDVNTCH